MSLVADGLVAELDRLRSRIAAALAILDGDGGFVLGQAWKPDGSWSKHDRCVHGEWRYDDCAACLETALRAALTEPSHAE